MTLVALSDTHGRLEELELPEGDVLIHTGDCARDGGAASSRAFLDWFASRPHRHKIFVPGNHDFHFMKTIRQVGKRRRERPAEFLLEEKGVHLLIDECVTIEGVKFLGTPWTLPFYDWAFMKNESELEELYDGFPRDPHVVLCHGPAFGILDRNFQGECCGSRSLKAYFAECTRLRHVIFGHIHEQRGRQIEGNVTYTNASVLGADYQVCGGAFVIEM